MAKDFYGSLGSADYEISGGGPLADSNVRANPNTFGAQIGQAMQNQGEQLRRTGKQTMAVAEEYAKKAREEEEKAVEAKVNDEYANVFIPKAAELRGQYDQLSDRDKAHGYENYSKQMQALNEQFVGTSANDYEKDLKTGLTQRRYIQEVESATRELSQAQVKLRNQAAVDRMFAEQGFQAANYNNPQYVEESFQAQDGIIEMMAIDNGINPDTEEGSVLINQAKQEARGQSAVVMINSAIQRGDTPEANKIREQYGPFIPGAQQLQIDRTLAVENLRQTGVNSVEAVINGQPYPEATGFPPTEVRATVAEVAEQNGVPVNHALTVAQIESAMGQITGTRKDIGQTGKGGDLKTQAFNMITELKKSENVARSTLGREPEPWEIYTCYQQGAGGGPELLKAAKQNPNARAVDVLKKFESRESGYDAYEAIIQNGGNASMTSGQFLTLLRDKYAHNAMLANCTVPGGVAATVPTPEGAGVVSQPAQPSVSAAIRETQKKTSPTVQPGANPIESMYNFQQNLAVMQERILAEPNDAIRSAAQERLNAMEGVYKSKAEAYKNEVFKQSDAIKYDENFVSMDDARLTPELKATLKQYFPEEYNSLRVQANTNRGNVEDPVVTSEFYGKIDSFFEKSPYNDKKIKVKPGKLDDIERTKEEILSASDQGLISGGTAKALLQNIQTNLAGMPGKSAAEYGGDHYARAFKTFAATGASIPEVNRMFSDYVAIAEEQSFDKLPERSWEQYWNKDIDKKQVFPNDAMEAVTKRYAENKYAGLVMLPEKPNAVIGKDGTHLVISWKKPEGKADTSIQITSQIEVDNKGRRALVFRDRDGKYVKHEQVPEGQ